MIRGDSIIFPLMPMKKFLIILTLCSITNIAFAADKVKGEQVTLDCINQNLGIRATISILWDANNLNTPAIITDGFANKGAGGMTQGRVTSDAFIWEKGSGTFASLNRYNGVLTITSGDTSPFYTQCKKVEKQF